MTDFIFRVESFNLTPEQAKHISAAIQGTVMHELARLDLNGGKQPGGAHAAAHTAGLSGGSFAFFPVLWNGGMLLKEFAKLPSLDKTVPTLNFSAGV